METKRQCLLPWKLGGVAVGMGAGIAPRATGGSHDSQLLADREVKKLIQMIVSEFDEAGVDAVVGDLEKSMAQARSPNEFGSILCGHIITLEEAL